MESASDALRSVSDALMQDLEALVNAEEEKRKVAPDDPRLVTIAAEVDQIARRLLGLTERQQDLAEHVHVQAIKGGADAPTEPIEETHRPIGVILAEWRTAEREVAAAAPGSVESETARTNGDRLREEYRRAYDALRK
jgi:hypothetical protein